MNRHLFSLCLLVFGGLLLGLCAPDPASAPLAAPTLESTELIILPEHHHCQKDEDCVIFPVECSDCDCETTLNRTYLEEYQQKKVEVCEGYYGKMCEIYCPVEPKCVQGKCVAALLQ